MSADVRGEGGRGGGAEAGPLGREGKDAVPGLVWPSLAIYKV